MSIPPKNKDAFKNKTLLVFGGCGFIGSNFIRHIFTDYPGIKIVNFDKLTYSGNRDNVKEFEKLRGKYVGLYEKDIADNAALRAAFEAYRPEYVINFAAETHVDRSIHMGSLEFIRTNVEGVFNIVEAVKTYGCEKYVQVSTDEVYGELPNPHDVGHPVEERFNENYPFKPSIPYSGTKAAGDCIGVAYFRTWKIPIVITHCSNNYGPYQYPEKMIPYWMSRLMRGKKIPVYGDGLNIRDWIHVDDHIRALVLSLLNGKIGETYNIGSDNEKTNLEVLELILSAAGELGLIKKTTGGGSSPFVQFVADRPGHDRRYAIDAGKITKELGWKPEITAEKFPEKLKETLKWYMDNRDWVERVIKRTGVVNAHVDLWEKTMNGTADPTPQIAKTDSI